MLVVTRRKGEEIVIDGKIRILVSHTSDGRCKLAIDAPDSCCIRRAEIAELQEAASTAASWRIAK